MTHRAGLPDYDDPARFPPRVWKAVENTRRNGFELACVPAVGRLLQMLAGARGVQRVCELGTAYGVGAAWIESGMWPGATLLTIENDPQRAAGASDLFAGNSAIQVLQGDWSLALEQAPFDMLFSDSGIKRNVGDPEKLLPLLNDGGLVVLDDYTPGYGPDDSRRLWLAHPAYRAIEVTLTAEMAVLLATKKQ